MGAAIRIGSKAGLLTTSKQAILKKSKS